MKQLNHTKTRNTIVRAGFIIAGLLTASVMGNPTFFLTDSETLDVTTAYSQGFLADNSSAHILPGGSVAQLAAIGNSSVLVSGGIVDDFAAFESSTITIQGGWVESFYTEEDTTVTITGGILEDYLGGYGQSNLSLSGGILGEYFWMDAGEEAYFTFYGLGWETTGDLTIDGDFVTGSGVGTLSGVWADGTAWSADVWKADTATIRLVTIPAPGAILMTSIGTVLIGWLRRRQAI